MLRYPAIVLEEQLPNVCPEPGDDQEAMPIPVNVLRSVADQVGHSQVLPALRQAKLLNWKGNIKRL